MIQMTHREIKVIKEILSNYTAEWVNMLLEQQNLSQDEIQSFWRKINQKDIEPND